MGFYIRKSVKVGPLRFNLSKSGIGISAGIPGFRIGTGPRGNYVHMGAGGLYYRQSLPSNGQSAPVYDEPQATPDTHAPLEKIGSGCVSQMADSSSAQLLQEIDQKRKKIRLWPIAATGSIVLLFLLAAISAPVWLLILLGVLFAAGIFVTYQRDELTKSVVLFYDFDPQMQKAYQLLHDWSDQLVACARAWHVDARGDVHDPKYHAGAGQIVNRKTISIHKGQPPFIKTNIETIVIPAGSETLYFFPDRVLVFAQNGVGAVNYRDLQIDINDKQFVEDQSVPRDAQVIDYTWQYVNKSGGPDRRFKDNRQIPVCLYEELWLSSQSGLNELIQLSRTGIGDGFRKAVAYLANVLPT
jgi:hypothetical protein